MPEQYFTYFHVALRGVFAWLPMGMKMPERYFTYFHEALRGVLAWLQ